MSKYSKVPARWKERILLFNRKRAADSDMAQDLLLLLAALPQGQRKQLMREEACAGILTKYGVAE